MTRKIKYKQISEEYKKMVMPNFDNSRSSIGMERDVGEYFLLPIDKLKSFKNQARKSFDQNEINDLAESIKLYGVRQPLTVMKSGDEEYEIVSGERRFMAAKITGLQKVPCIIIKDNEDSDAIALIENIHRKDLNILELGNIYKSLIDKGIFRSQTDLSRKISVSTQHICEVIKLSEIPNNIQELAIKNNLTTRNELRKIYNFCKKGDIDSAIMFASKNKIESNHRFIFLFPSLAPPTHILTNFHHKQPYFKLPNNKFIFIITKKTKN